MCCTLSSPSSCFFDVRILVTYGTRLFLLSAGLHQYLIIYPTSLAVRNEKSTASFEVTYCFAFGETETRTSESTDLMYAAYSAATDFTLALLPWAILWNLQMKRREKFGVAVAMSLGVLYVKDPDLL